MEGARWQDNFDLFAIVLGQAMLTKAGREGQGVGFLITDSQIVNDHFLVRLAKGHFCFGVERFLVAMACLQYLQEGGESFHLHLHASLP